MLQRIIVPAGLAGVLFAGPLYTYQVEDPVRQKTVSSTATAFEEIQPTIGCLQENGFGAIMSCQPESLMGFLFVGAFAGALLAAVLGLLGVLPGFKKLGAFVGILTGAVAVAAAGWIGYSVFGTGGGADTTISWGLYGAAGVGLLMLLMGFVGLRSDD